MEKKDYFSLQSKYLSLRKLKENYRITLWNFINDAFENHGNEFEYIRDSHDTWKIKKNECSVKGNPPINISMVHDDDICRERFRRHFTDNGEVFFEAEEWDLDGYQFVKRVDIHSDTDELETIEVFINVVLEQEQEQRIAQMEERIDWEDLMEDIRVSIKNEELWAMGASSEESVMHLQNVEDLKVRLEMAERKDFQSLLEFWDEDFFKDFML